MAISWVMASKNSHSGSQIIPQRLIANSTSNVEEPSFLINAGRGIYEVANLLGHTQLKTTQRYAHLADQTLREAVNTVPLVKAA